jgi:hypothetical protein
MTPQLLDEAALAAIRARWAKADDGPWWWDFDCAKHGGMRHLQTADGGTGILGPGSIEARTNEVLKDAIAAAPTDIAALLAHVDALVAK